MKVSFKKFVLLENADLEALATEEDEYKKHGYRLYDEVEPTDFGAGLLILVREKYELR